MRGYNVDDHEQEKQPIVVEIGMAQETPEALPPADAGTGQGGE